MFRIRVNHPNNSFQFVRQLPPQYLKLTRLLAPVFESFTPTLHNTTFAGNLFNYPPSVYRADPSPDTDAAWDFTTFGPWILITRDDVIRLGFDPSTRAKASTTVTTAYPKDADMYFSFIDAFHQTHCLDMIRRHSYWFHYYEGHYGSWDHAHETHWTHISHCFNILLQGLKCTASPEVMTAVWMEGQEAPFPDFNVNKKCGNFEGLVEWQSKRIIPKELYDQGLIVKPPEEDIKTLFQAPPELYMMKNVDYPEGYVFDHEVPEHKDWYSSW